MTFIFSGSATLCAQQFASNAINMSSCQRQGLQHTAACGYSRSLPHHPSLPEAIKITSGFLDQHYRVLLKDKITSKSGFRYGQISNFPPEISSTGSAPMLQRFELHLLVTCRTVYPLSDVAGSGHRRPLHVSFSSNESWDHRDGNENTEIKSRRRNLSEMNNMSTSKQRRNKYGCFQK